MVRSVAAHMAPLGPDAVSRRLAQFSAPVLDELIAEGVVRECPVPCERLHCNDHEWCSEECRDAASHAAEWAREERGRAAGIGHRTWWDDNYEGE
jgi:hypothetical protein